MTAYSSDIALCDEIVNELRARQWRLPFDPERTWLPEWSVKGGELDLLRVTVNPWIVPSGTLTERNDVDEDDDQPNPQAGMWSVWPIDISFCQRLTDQSLEQIDGLANLVEQVRQFLCPQRFQLDDDRLFESLEFEYLARFDPSLLNRVVVKNKVRYTGVFLSAFRIPFRQLP